MKRRKPALLLSSMLITVATLSLATGVPVRAAGTEALPTAGSGAVPLRSPSTRATAQAGAGLFVAAPNGTGLRLPSNPTALRARLVTVQLPQIGAPRVSEPITGSVAPALTLNLFDDVAVVARLDQVVVNPHGGFSWIGHLDGTPLSTVILTVRDDFLYASINSPQGVYEVSQLGGAVHVITQIDQAAFGEKPDDPLPSVVSQTSRAPAVPATDDGSLIDVLVAYTSLAKNGAGGRAQIEALIDSSINTTNQTYANSAINQRVRLAGTVEVNYAETQNSTLDDANLVAGSAGLQVLHDLRDATAADLVIMIVEQLEPNIAGRAYDIMGTVSNAFESSAYAVVTRGSAVSNLSFPHELGHLMGARHDWYVDATNNQPYSFNHGYVLTPTLPNPWRTVMAYNDRCKASGGNCTRISYWSNPGLSNAGYRLGVPAGTNTSCTANNMGNPQCDADDSQALNNTAFTVANFRSGNLPVVFARTFCSTIPSVGCFEDGSTGFPYDTVTEAIFRAAPGATVLVSPGNYPETLMLATKTPHELVIKRSVILVANGAGTVTIGP